MAKWVYKFYEGSATTRNLLGGKGRNSAEMTNLRVPIPQGFIATTEACTGYYSCDRQIPQETQDQIFEAITWLEGINDKKFGDTEDPLLVSVCSGAHASMPGMMDTVLNLGLNDAAVEEFAKKTGSPRFAHDSYRRFIQTYFDVIMEVPKSYFEKIIDEMKEAKDVHFDTDLTAGNLKELAAKFKATYRGAMSGKGFPQNPTEQLMGAVKAVFRSWDNPRAIVYRRMSGTPGDQGIAVNIQTMVFRNKGETSGIDVALTRNPSAGAEGIYDKYLIDIQGKDVAAGVRTPQPISKLAEDLLECCKEFMDLAIRPEDHFRDMQDIGFIIGEGKLYFSQTRNGKRTAPAAIQVVCDSVDEGMITPEGAVCKIEAKLLNQLLHPTFVPEALKAGEIIGGIFPASPSAATDKVYFTADETKNVDKGGGDERVVPVRLEIPPEDIEGMHTAQGILTARGGVTSHAVVIARGMGICCVPGCSETKIDEEAKVFELGGYTFRERDYISLDGSTGKIYKGDIAAQEATVSGNFERIMEWADQFRTLCVRTNTDTPADTPNVVKLGVEGTGLCHTEHMFLDVERIPKIRKMILSETVEQREEVLDELVPSQKGDFKAMYGVLEGGPMTVHYLDSPLHESVPTDSEGIKAPADDMRMTVEAVDVEYAELHEFNPMMGHRGCRLVVTYPEIARIQTRAVMEAATEVKEECGYGTVPEIMIPLVGEKKESKYTKDIVTEIAGLVKKEKSSDIQYHIGIMIETPRAALTAGKVAEEADFSLFGINDLTRMTFGFLHDDTGKLLDSHYKAKIYEPDPLARLNQEGVGQLVKMAAEKGCSTKADLKCGICSERDGSPSSVEFCHRTGLNYVSCSPFRVPITRLAAAQAALNSK